MEILLGHPEQRRIVVAVALTKEMESNEQRNRSAQDQVQELEAELKELSTLALLAVARMSSTNPKVAIGRLVIKSPRNHSRT